MMGDDKKVTGGCECGRVRYSARRTGSSATSCWCYCLQCQRLSGGPFLPFVDFKKKDVEWTTPPDVFSSSDDAERDFCKDCGSTIGMRYHFQEDSLGIVLGTIDENCDFVPDTSYHIFVKDKPAWFQIPNDGKPQYQRFPDDRRYEEGMQQWRKSHPEGRQTRQPL